MKRTRLGLGTSAFCALAAAAPNASAQCQVDTVESVIPSANQGFGEALGLSENYMVSGATLNGNRTYQVFRRIGGEFYPQDMIFSRLGTDLSTRSDFDDSLLVIGLGDSGFYGELDPHAPNPAGEVDIYDVSSPGGFVEITITPSDAIAGQGFGGAVAVDDGVVVVGSQHAPGISGVSEGAVYVFEKVSGAWAETQTLFSAVPEPFNMFGGTVEISGDRIGVGTAPFSIIAFGDAAVPPNGLIAPLGNGIGRIEVFAKDTAGVWQSRQLLEDATVGWAIDSTRFVMDGDQLFVSAAPLAGAIPGVGALGQVNLSVLVFDWNESTENYELSQALRPQDGATLDLFGDRLEAEGGTLLVSAPLRTPNSTLADGGAAYVFKKLDGLWSQTARLMPNGQPLNQTLSSPISVCGDHVIIGNDTGGFLIGGNERESYVFAVGGDCDADGSIDGCQIEADGSLDINLNGRLDTCERGSARPFCSGGMNSMGQRAKIRSMGDMGSLSVSHGTFEMEATGATLNAPGLFFTGDRQVSVPFGDGVRCVGGLRRLGGRATSAGGVAQFSFDVEAEFGAAALSGTWYFQYLYRDGGSNWNLTNGLAVNFIP